MTDFDVAIIGAGLAGLAAAHHLLALSAIEAAAGSGTTAHPKIIILEARDRVGGRTNTISSAVVPDAVVDVGGQWVGPRHDNLLGMIADFNLELIEQEFSVVAETDGGEGVSERLVECANFGFNPLTPAEVQEVQIFRALVEEVSGRLSLSAPWDLTEAEEFDRHSVAGYVNAQYKTTGARAEILLFVQTVMACDPENCSFLFFLFYVAAGGGMQSLGDGAEGAQKWKVKGGCQQVSERLLEKCVAHDGVQCRMGLAVKSVEGGYTEGFRITMRNTSPPPSSSPPPSPPSSSPPSSSSSSSIPPAVITSRKVIVAFSPSVLEQQRVCFTPPLPPEKLALSRAMRMGRCVKLILAYTSEFWQGSFHMSTNFGVTATVQDLGYAHNIFKSCVGEHPALVLLITGSSAESYMLLSEEERLAAVYSQLSRMYSTDLVVTSTPVEIIEKDWMGDDFSSGCFAGILPAGVLTSLREHIYSASCGGALQWASTEVAMRHYGYMEGAVVAGKAAAEGCWRSLHQDV